MVPFALKSISTKHENGFEIRWTGSEKLFKDNLWI